MPILTSFFSDSVYDSFVASIYNSLFNYLNILDINYNFSPLRSSKNVKLVFANNVSGFNLYYYQIWFNPKRIDLGFVDKDTNTNLEVWNSYFESKTVNEINKNNLINESISPNTTPIVLNPLSDNYFTISVPQDGSVIIDGNFEFVFNDNKRYYVKLIGRRAELFDIPPLSINNSGFNLKILFSNSVFISYDNKEIRRAIYDNYKIFTSINLLHDDRNLLMKINRLREKPILLYLLAEIYTLSQSLIADSNTLYINENINTFMKNSKFVSIYDRKQNRLYFFKIDNIDTNNNIIYILGSIPNELSGKKDLVFVFPAIVGLLNNIDINQFTKKYYKVEIEIEEIK